MFGHVTPAAPAASESSHGHKWIGRKPVDRTCASGILHHGPLSFQAAKSIVLLLCRILYFFRRMMNETSQHVHVFNQGRFRVGNDFVPCREMG